MINRFLYISVCFALGVASSSLYGQANTRGSGGIEDTVARLVNHGDNSATETHKILIIPFYSNMCMSEIDKDVNKATNLDFKHITEEFRKGLDFQVYAAAHQNYVAISLLQGKYKSDSILSYIYGSTTYKYDLVPGTVADVGAAPDSSKKKHYIKNGQLEVPVDYSKRFMNISIQNPKLLPFLYKKYNTDIFVFINELDIKNVDNPTQDLTEDTYRREVTVHYSIIDKDGHSVAKGLATTYFPFKENTPTEISEKYFTKIAHSILKDYKQGLTINTLSEQQKKQAIKPKSMINTNQ